MWGEEDDEGMKEKTMEMRDLPQEEINEIHCGECYI